MKRFLSVPLRYLVNVESLNGVESVGNISRHRVAPVVLPVDKDYVVKYVPVVSGESIAHAYQSILVKEAMDESLPVGNRSSMREFIKYADEGTVKEEVLIPPSNINDVRSFEVDVMLHDLVADVGGFFYAGMTPVKRTSSFSVSYMIPAYDTNSETATLDAQFHVRMTPSNPIGGG
jgi:CRISPR-associated protein Csa2